MKPSWSAVEAARAEEGLKVEPAMRLLGMSLSMLLTPVASPTAMAGTCAGVVAGQAA